MSPQLKANRQLIRRQITQLQDDLIFFYNEQWKEPQLRKWQLLFDHFFTKKTGQPSAGWKRKTTEMIDLIHLNQYQSYSFGFLKKFLGLLKLIHQKKTGSEIYFLSEQFQELFKGIIWAVPIAYDTEAVSIIENIGLLCFKKIPTHGAVSIKIGNACLYSLANLPNQQGIEQLLHFRNKITYPSVRKRIAKHLQKMAKETGLTTDELEEMAISDFGLDKNQTLTHNFDPYQGIIQIDQTGNIKISWTKNGQPLRSVPKFVTTEYPEDLAVFKSIGKKVKAALPVQRNRIEGFYLRRRQWTYAKWKMYYFDHALLRNLTQRLIWQFSEGSKKAVVFFYENKWQSATGQIIDWIKATTTVTLWHPLHAAASVVLDWRNWLTERQIQQPFKQAYREIYILTDAERETVNYSNRFAAHILRQHQFAALCKVRHWQYKLKGYWENDSIPTLDITAWNMSAEFWVEVDWDGEMTPAKAFNLVFSDQVRFYEQDEQLEMDEVPPLVFSEVMRDVDLFVGVTSIGNDPGWQDAHTEHNDYWQQYSFSELTASAKVRKEALQQLIPRLKIAKQCSFEGRFLIVKGQRKTYKIHIGSGNILMEPNDQYLCIVPNRKAPSLDNKVFLPFEGDQLLSIIVSKAMLLAADRQIKDPVILEQLVD